MTLRSKPRMGRPPKPPGEKRGESVTVWLTLERHAAVVEAAEREGRTISDWGAAAFDLAIARGSTR